MSSGICLCIGLRKLFLTMIAFKYYLKPPNDENDPFGTCIYHWKHWNYICSTNLCGMENTYLSHLVKISIHNPEHVWQTLFAVHWWFDITKTWTFLNNFLRRSFESKDQLVSSAKAQNKLFLYNRNEETMTCIYIKISYLVKLHPIVYKIAVID